MPSQQHIKKVSVKYVCCTSVGRLYCTLHCFVTSGFTALNVVRWNKKTEHLG